MCAKIMKLFCCVIFITSALAEPISIKIDTRHDASVEVTGRAEGPVNNDIKNAFQIPDDTIKLGIQYIMRQRPDDISLGNWTDVYKTKNWTPVKRIVVPFKAQVVGTRTEPVIVSRQKFGNTYNKPATFRATITSDVSNTVSSTWTMTESLTLDQQFTFDFAILSASERISFTSTWGESLYKEKTSAVGSSSEVMVELDPGNEVEAILYATRGVVDVELDYVASLIGDVACKFDNFHRGRMFWRQDVNFVLDTVKVPLQIQSRQMLTIKSYSEAKVVLVNATTQAIINEIPGVFLGSLK